MASQSVRRDTSTCNVIAVPPSCSTSRDVSAAPTSSTSAIAIAAPCRAKSNAAARPCPDAAPVISATLPASTASSGTTSDRRQHSDACQRGAPACCVASRRIARLGLRCGVPTDPIAEYGALFVRDGERFVATPLGRGPWSPNALHGGAPSALLAHVLAPPRSRTRVVHRAAHGRTAATGADRRAASRRAHDSPGQEGAVAGRRCCSPTVSRSRAPTALRLRPEEVDVADAVSPPVPAPPPVSAGAPPADRSSSTGSTSATGPRTTSGSYAVAFGVAGPASRLAAAEVPGRGGGAGRAVRAGRGRRRLRQRHRQPAHVRDRVGDQSRGQHPHVPPSRRASGSGWSRAVRGRARRRPGRDDAARRARAARTRRADVARQPDRDGGGRPGFAPEDSPPQP